MAKILLVDDDVDFLKMMQSRLEVNGYEVITASNGLEGLEKAKEIHPDIILLNVMMPELSGVTTALRLKEIKELKSIPVIIVTGIKEAETALLIEHIQVSDYIIKPFKPEDLLVKIKNVLKEKKE